MKARAFSLLDAVRQEWTKRTGGLVRSGDVTKLTPDSFHVRNAPTRLMKALGHSKGYRRAR